MASLHEADLADYGAAESPQECTCGVGQAVLQEVAAVQ